MKEIELTQGLKAQVDDEDYERLNRFKWYAHKMHKSCYAHRNEYLPSEKRQTTIQMHNEIIGKPPVGFVRDHIDGDGTNNQKSNLRFVTNRQNCQNRKNQNKTSVYPGVSWFNRTNRWRAQVEINEIQKSIGYFPTEQEAFQAYKTAVESIGEQVIEQENRL